VVVDAEALKTCAVLAVPTASIAMTLTKTPVFNWVRDRLPQNSLVAAGAECPYCMSHWVAGMFILFYQPHLFGGNFVDLFPGWFFTVTCAAFLVQVMLIFGKVIGLLER
jgi:ABC-type sulfate transport system permease component